MNVNCRAAFAALLLTAALLAPPNTPAAAPSPSAAPAGSARPEAKAKRSTYPYHGELAKADLTKRVIYLSGKVKERVILLTPRTRIRRGDKPAKLEDAQPGEKVSGIVKKNAQGAEEAVTLNLKGFDPGKKAEPVKP